MPQNAKGRDSTAAGILRMFRADRLLLQTRKEDAPRGHQNIDRQQPRLSEQLITTSVVVTPS